MSNTQVYIYWLGGTGNWQCGSYRFVGLSDLPKAPAGSLKVSHNLAGIVPGTRLSTIDELSNVSSPPIMQTAGLSWELKTPNYGADGVLIHNTGTNNAGLWISSDHVLTQDEESALMGIVPPFVPPASGVCTGISTIPKIVGGEDSVAPASMPVRLPSIPTPPQSSAQGRIGWSVIVAIIVSLMMGYYLLEKYPKQNLPVILLTIGLIWVSILLFKC